MLEERGREKGEGETCTAVELNSSLCHDISATYVYKSSLRKHRCTLPNKVISSPHYNRVHCTSTRPVDKAHGCAVL